MAIKGGKEDLELRGEGGHVRLIIPQRLRGKDLRLESRGFLEKASGILKDASVVVDLKGSGWDRGDILSVVESILLPVGASVLSWSPEEEDVRSWMKREGFALYLSGTEEKARMQPRPLVESLVIDESLRSGRKIDHDGDIMILGNVNEGAEVFAGRSVVVVGRLRGLAHAGLTGPEEAFIVSGQFEASQVRIGDRISYMDEHCAWWGKTVSMKVVGGSIVVREIVL
ncbi:MAG TPA: septum site-determining protein MinC [Synergistales bacterium]|jgi:septum site-determining protein MinC|nr:septum site-determining protein MinC [Synergistales bacterium]MDI9392610.1 septum site-determining protein MinC [Synergistota bacterium]NLV65246.1 septum site-determining protein MinC [Synergistaceae bacterium]HOI82105.1 septum site-determining protein MinC [Synergistales bacterium]